MSKPTIVIITREPKGKERSVTDAGLSPELKNFINNRIKYESYLSNFVSLQEGSESAAVLKAWAKEARLTKPPSETLWEEVLLKKEKEKIDKGDFSGLESFIKECWDTDFPLIAFPFEAQEKIAICHSYHFMEKDGYQIIYLPCYKNEGLGQILRYEPKKSIPLTGENQQNGITLEREELVRAIVDTFSIQDNDNQIYIHDDEWAEPADGRYLLSSDLAKKFPKGVFVFTHKVESNYYLGILHENWREGIEIEKRREALNKIKKPTLAEGFIALKELFVKNKT
jgi:hypothetical protein